MDVPVVVPFRIFTAMNQTSFWWPENRNFENELLRQPNSIGGVTQPSATRSSWPCAAERVLPVGVCFSSPMWLRSSWS